ncbi:MAG: DUF3987 domain-containing protein [Gemmatimonadota bacterium]|nr:MAG: DUF3987 domain-containing protein [Gemmatimonadota bacterium]
MICDDCTPEKLGELMHNQGGRIGVFSSDRDVFEIMAGRYSRNGTPHISVYNKGHSGDPL